MAVEGRRCRRRRPRRTVPGPSGRGCGRSAADALQPRPSHGVDRDGKPAIRLRSASLRERDAALQHGKGLSPEATTGLFRVDRSRPDDGEPGESEAQRHMSQPRWRAGTAPHRRRDGPAEHRDQRQRSGKRAGAQRVERGEADIPALRAVAAGAGHENLVAATISVAAVAFLDRGDSRQGQSRCVMICVDHGCVADGVQCGDAEHGAQKQEESREALRRCRLHAAYGNG